LVVGKLRLAWRNISRNRMRSAIALSAIGFSVVALLLAGGFIEWIFWATREAAIQNGLGHIHVVRPGYLDSGTADPNRFLLPQQSPEMAALEAVPDVVVVAPRLNFSGLISHGDSTVSFVGEGVDPQREPRISRVLQIVRGEGISETAPKGVILGAGLAASLGVAPGDVVALLVTKQSGGVNAVEASVRGVFMTEAKAYDDTALRAPIELVRDLLKVSGSHVWVIGLDKTEHTADVLRRLRSRFPSADLQFVPWYDLSDFYGKTVALLSGQMNVVRVMIGLIIVLSISNLLVMSVLERTGEIGTLMAIGTRRRTILELFLSEGVLLGLLGAAIGLATGMILAWIISTIGIPMPPPPGRSAGYSAAILLTWPLILGAAALALGTTIVASFYPAWKASRLDVVDALRRNR
jgi:putative ABC transport system permease protein